MIAPNAPTCPQCEELTIKADAGILSTIPYWYCRACKVEVLNNYEIAKPTDTITLPFGYSADFETLNDDDSDEDNDGMFWSSAWD